MRADEPAALDVAARHADVVRIAAPSLDIAHALRERVRAAAAAAGRRPDHLAVLLDVEVHLAGDAADARASLRQRDRTDAAAAVDAAGGRRGGGSGQPGRAHGGHARRRRRSSFLALGLPADLFAITGQVVPLLAGRGLFRTGSPGMRLRARFQPRRLPAEVGVAS